jgi:hypothetical protein
VGAPLQVSWPDGRKGERRTSQGRGMDHSYGRKGRGAAATSQREGMG